MSEFETFDDFDFVVRAQKEFEGDPCTSSNTPGCGSCCVCCKLPSDFDYINSPEPPPVDAGTLVWCQETVVFDNPEGDDYDCLFKETGGKPLCCGVTSSSFELICPTSCKCNIDDQNLNPETPGIKIGDPCDGFPCTDDKNEKVTNLIITSGVFPLGTTCASCSLEDCGNCVSPCKPCGDCTCQCVEGDNTLTSCTTCSKLSECNCDSKNGDACDFDKAVKIIAGCFEPTIGTKDGISGEQIDCDGTDGEDCCCFGLRGENQPCNFDQTLGCNQP